MNGDDSSFEQCYRCYPVSFIEKPHLENGDKIIMPPSALNRLASLHIDYPMMFQLSNDSLSKTTHCGVLEFTADEGLVYFPSWMMQNMSLQEGEIVRIKNTSLVKGTYIKLQPHTQDFLDITNPKAMFVPLKTEPCLGVFGRSSLSYYIPFFLESLEKTLRSYSCLTTGDTIMVPYNNKQYFINVVEAKPSSAVSIIETDCEVDFAPPLDYKEPEKPQKLTPSNKRTQKVEEEEPTSKVPKFTPFTGPGKRLDGKTQTESTQEEDSTKQEEKPSENGKDDERLSSTTPPQKSGKLVFGSSSKRASKATVKVDPKNTEQESSTKSDEAKFQVFTGKKYSLNG